MIKEMRDEDKPRERFAHSPGSASMTDLVAILLRTGTQGNSVKELAKKVVDYLEPESGISRFEDLNWRDLLAIRGIGPDKAVTICAAVELGRRLTQRFDKQSLSSFNSPAKVAHFFMEKLRHENQEHFICCYLNIKNKLLGYQVITTGSLGSAPVDIKETMRWGLRYKAYGLILVHNHPSGFPEPSEEDIRVTRRFISAAHLLDMNLVDHIIIGDGKFISLRREGQI